MLGFEWVGKNVSFYLSVVHLVLRASQTDDKLCSSCTSDPARGPTS